MKTFKFCSYDKIGCNSYIAFFMRICIRYGFTHHHPKCLILIHLILPFVLFIAITYKPRFFSFSFSPWITDGVVAKVSFPLLVHLLLLSVFFLWWITSNCQPRDRSRYSPAALYHRFLCPILLYFLRIGTFSCIAAWKRQISWLQVATWKVSNEFCLCPNSFFFDSFPSFSYSSYNTWKIYIQPVSTSDYKKYKCFSFSLQWKIKGRRYKYI